MMRITHSILPRQSHARPCVLSKSPRSWRFAISAATALDHHSAQTASLVEKETSEPPDGTSDAACALRATRDSREKCTNRLVDAEVGGTRPATSWVKENHTVDK